MKKVSVVIPVYNAQKYLKKCIGSVINQSLKDIEIILVNDASEDNSLAVCRKYEERDSRIVVINKLFNGGVEKARHDGLLQATGEYVSFLDADDWLPTNALKLMYEKSQKNQPEIIVGRVKKVIDPFGLIKKNNIFVFDKDTLVSRKTFIKQYYKAFFGTNLFDVSMWAKLYKRQILLQQKIDFLGHQMGEDLVFNLQVFPRALKILFVNDFVYYYRFGGMTTKYNKHLWPAELKMFELKKRYLMKYNLKHLENLVYVELKNYLRTYIGMHIRFNGYKVSTSLINNVDEILHSNKQVLDLKEYFTHVNNKDIFVKAILDNDSHKMCEIIEVNENKMKIKRKILFLLSKLLNI